MKYVLVSMLLVLAVASVGTYLSLPERQSGLPVLYWVTDPNPARDEQIRMFQEWMRRNSYPEFILKTDSANQDAYKKVIQSVSGVGGDIMDLGDAQAIYLYSMGVLEDVTSAARRLGFDPGKTYATLEPQLSLDGRQYRFPCNVATPLLWVNAGTFRKAGMDAPPRQWDFATFERIGKEFVTRANAGQLRQTIFFSHKPNPGMMLVMRRSLGLDSFNETRTRCVLDDGRYVRVLELMRKWTLEDLLFPTAADEASFTTDVGYGGPNLQLFYAGNYAMVFIGRYALIQWRQMGKVDLSLSRVPCEEFLNSLITTRAASVYKGGPHKDLAVYFLAFLASPEYNMHIVRDSDSLPPSPAFTENDAFRHPPEWPNEWKCHELEAETAKTIAIAGPYSPFIQMMTVGRLEQQALDKVLTGLYSPEEAAKELALLVNQEIARTLKDRPELRDRYGQMLQQQEQIDRLRREGKKVPARLIDNHFHLRYYQWKGWIE